MSFMDPIGFSSYSMYPMGQQSMVMPPAVQSQYYPSYGGGSPFGGGFPPQGPPPCPYGPMGGGGDAGGVTALLGNLLNMFMSIFMGQNQGPDTSLPPEEGPTGPTGPDNGGNTDTPPETPVDTREQDIEGLNPDSNTDALQILSTYASDLGAKNGKLDMKTLKKVANLDVPDVVKKAAKNLVDNPELYNLLCLKSHNSPREGFRTSVLDDDWDGKVDVDNLETFSSTKEAMQKLQSSGKLDALAKLNGNDSIISRDDLEKVALGTAGSQFKDPELQAAALKLLSDTDSWSSLDTINASSGAYDQAQDNAFDQTAVAKWIATN